MTDCTIYPAKDFLYLLKANYKYRQIIASAKEWEQVVKVIDSLDVKYTKEQLEFVKQKQWD